MKYIPGGAGTRRSSKPTGARYQSRPSTMSPATRRLVYGRLRSDLDPKPWKLKALAAVLVVGLFITLLIIL